MGSFSYTCGISGLPIGGGDPVRFLILTKNPYDEIACYPYSRWVPRTFPLKARYNDYGTIKDVEEGLQRDLWLQGLQWDLVEKGTGDNSCHDIPVRKDMSFEGLLEVLWENRATVRYGSLPQLESGKYRSLTPEPPEGIPTLQRIEKVLREAGCETSKGLGSEGFLLGTPRHGWISVRWDHFGGDHGKELSKLLPHLTQYSTMITMGTGAYSREPELLIAAHPGKYEYCFQENDLRKELPLAQCMIREDIWQALLDLPPRRSFWEKHTSTKEMLLSALIKVYHLTKKAQAQQRSAKDLSHWQLLEDLRDEIRDGVTSVVTHSMPPFCRGWADHLKLAMDGDHSLEELMPLLKTAAETAYVYDQLFEIRHLWAPGHTVGSQTPEWQGTLRFHKKVVKICKAQRRQQRQDNETTVALILPEHLSADDKALATELSHKLRQEGFYVDWHTPDKLPGEYQAQIWITHPSVEHVLENAEKSDSPVVLDLRTPWKKLLKQIPDHY